MSRYNHKFKCVLLGFYVIDQHKIVQNFEVEGKYYMVCKLIYNKSSEDIINKHHVCNFISVKEHY